MIVILTGAAGAGKTVVGEMLARDLGWPFYDADDFHSPSNVKKMTRGVPLSDADRRPWLAALRSLIERLVCNHEDAVLACSALKEQYRRTIAGGVPEARIVYLKAAAPVLRRRLEQRRGHFMKSKMLDSQLAALEEPADALTINAAEPPEAIVATIRRQLRL